MNSESAASPSTPRAFAAECLDGNFELVRFVGLGEKSTYGTGEGGDVTVRFDNGSYELLAKGEPITVVLAGQQGRLVAEGTTQGDYTTEGSMATFRVGDSSGEATVSVGGATQTLSMSDVANVIAPSGTADVACSPLALVITLDQVRLDFSKV